MTSLYLSSIADAISSISISGITVKDKDQVSVSWQSIPYVLYPNPENWIEGGEATYNVAGGLESFSYTLHYRLLTVAVGDSASYLATFSDLSDKVAVVLGALLDVIAPYSDNVEMKVAGVSAGTREDPAGNLFLGADFALQIVESHG